ncbi:hemagglutinin repeat-containing protein [Variovorax sp. H27-G14]|uniref:two-partner secretion domain-containing protein n=1 Tax=Variovorax sp. H27-G14 TaxID=3111914 RepID=UPI0038FCC3DD
MIRRSLGGFVQGNPFLARGPARIILNEVNGGVPSQLRGYVEVGGQRAEVIIANPAGISVSGGGFINASRATLTTGVPQFNAAGQLDSFLVRGGTVTIDGAGLDLSRTDYAAILARAVQVNAGIWASELKVVTGANQVSADHGQVTPVAASGAVPGFALDVAALGGMYAQKISLIGTEAGLGVRNAGSIGAGAGGLVVTAAGRLENIGTIEGPSLQLSTPGDIDNRGGTIRQTGMAGLTIGSAVLSNTGGGVIGAQAVGAGAGPANSGSANPGSTSPTSGQGMATSLATDSGNAAGEGSFTPAVYTPPAPGAITAGGTISNDAGRIYAGGPIPLNTPQIDNAGGTLNVVALAVTGPKFSNAGGTLNVSRNFSADVARLDNSGGTLRASSVQIHTTGDLVNVDGTLASASDTQLTVGGKADNTRGTVSAVGALSADVAGAVDNTAGTLLANNNVALKAASLDNGMKGSVQLAQGATRLNVAGALSQGDGAVGAATDLSVRAGALNSSNGGSLRGANDVDLRVGGALVNGGSITAGRNTTISAGSVTSGSTGVLGAGVGSDGTLGGVGELRVTASGALVANGTNLAAGNTTLQGASVELSGSQTQAANIALTATQGDVRTTDKAKIVTPGTLSITANAQPRQTFVNGAGKLTAGRLDLKVSNLTNARLGEIVQTGAEAATVLAVSGTLNNDGGRIASNSQDLSLSAATLGNASGKIEHAGAGTFRISGGSYAGEGGHITGNGALVVDVARSFDQDHGQTHAGQITIDAGSLSNRGGKILGSALSVNTRGGALDNSTKGTMSAAGPVTLRSGALNNDAGLIQSGGSLHIDTNRETLTNTNAANYKALPEDKTGGIVSAGPLTLKTGKVENSAGAIASKGALSADTLAFTNTARGEVIGRSTVTIDTHGAGYDNAGGQTVAAGDLRLNAGAGTIGNKGGLIRSGASAMLDAASVVNTDTSDAQQGIEGRNVTVTSSASVNNTAGRMSAVETLRIKDPNAANPAGRTLSVTNTNGVLMGGQPSALDADGTVTKGVGGVFIEAKSFSGDGRIASANDLGIALGEDATNNQQLGASGNLTYKTSGKFTNNAKLSAGRTLRVEGDSIDNNAGAEMSGKDTVVSATKVLVNRGLIDSQGATQIDAGTLNNIGTGRIYGDAVSVAAGTLNNQAETIDGVTRAATIAARKTLNIGAGTVNNREHALIFSGGAAPKALNIGRELDANRQATESGGVLNNESARIESLGGMTISMGQINNVDTRVKLGTPTITKEFARTIGVEGIGFFKLEDIAYAPGKPNLTLRNPGGPWRAANGHVWGLWDSTVATTTDNAVDADPAVIAAGGDMTLNGAGVNRNSRITAGATLTAPGIGNEALQGEVTTQRASIVHWRATKRSPDVIEPVTRVSKDVGAYVKTGNLNATRGYDAGNSPGGATGGQGVVTIVEVPANVGMVVQPGWRKAGAAVGDKSNASTRTSTSQTIPMVVRTSTPRTAVPQASLFNLNSGPRGYLVETDPRFANYRAWLSSDYLLNNLGLDPNTTLKRLGDGFYEQKLIREQVAQLTGYGYLGGHYNDEAQYTALMNNGATFAKQYGLRPGIALTAAQMAQLTSDIVWLVEQTVTLPDGSTQSVLAPQLYVRVRPGDIDGSGALLSADATFIEGTGDLANTGTIAGRTLVKIDKDNVNNMGGRIAGGDVDVHARKDINNTGGRITAEDSAVLKADRDVNIETTTRTQDGLFASRTNIDRVAGVYVSNPGGSLIVNAGNNVNLIGGVLSNTGKDSFTSVTAKKSINLGTVTEASRMAVVGAKRTYREASSKETGSTITGNGTVLLNALGGDINVRASSIAAGPGVLGLTAAGDINIFADEETRSTADQRQDKKKRILKTTTTTTTTDSEEESTTSIASRLSGGSVGLFADGDINVVGSDIEAQKNALIKAKRRVNIVSSTDSTSSSVDTARTTKGLFVPKLTDSNIDRKRVLQQHADVSSQTQRASNITAGENLTVIGDEEVTVFASHLGAGEDLYVKGGKVRMLSGLNESSIESGTKTSRQSIGTTGMPTRTGTGMNGKSNVTDRVYETTLAPTTLSGKNVKLEATEGDLTLAAAQIRAEEKVTLSAVNGKLNMALVKTAKEVSQKRGESDPLYQRTRETGSYEESANYTRIDSASLALKTPKVNVEWGQKPVKEQNGAAAQQTLEQVLAVQRNQPGMGWLEQVQNDAALNKLQIDWQSVPLAQREWAQKQGSLTQAGGAVVAIVVAVLTWGVASGVGAAASSGLSGATATVANAAVSAAVSSIASQAAVGLINNNGDIGKVIQELTSKQGVKSIVTAMATAGVLQGLNIGLGMEGYTAANVGTTLADGTTVGWAQVLQRNLINGVSASIVHSAIQGTSVEQGIKNGLLTGLLNTAASGSAKWIGENGPDGNQNLNRLAAEVAHAIAGCAVGAGRASGGGGASGSAGCKAGAVGAFAGHLTGQLYNPNADPEYAERTIKLGQMVSGVAGALVGGTQEAADIAAAAGPMR